MKNTLAAFITVITAQVYFVFQKPKIKRERDSYDCAVVCGFPADENGNPSAILKTRVEKGIDLWKKGIAKRLIFSGAAVANEFTEAEVMRKYAVSMGVPEEAIVKEEKAVSTYHNLKYVKEIMQNENINNCIVVTNGWHIRKADYYARKFKLDYVMAKADNPEGETVFVTLWRYLSVNIQTYVMMFRGYY